MKGEKADHTQKVVRTFLVFAVVFVLFLFWRSTGPSSPLPSPSSLAPASEDDVATELKPEPVEPAPNDKQPPPPDVKQPPPPARGDDGAAKEKEARRAELLQMGRDSLLAKLQRRAEATPPPPAANAGSADEPLIAGGQPKHLQYQTRGKVTSDHLHGDLIGRHDDGTPGWRPVPYVSPEQETRAMKERAHAPNAFNLPRSDSLPLDRPVPTDVMPWQCKQRNYDLHALPSTSVVFIFFNEPLSTLLRSVHSVLNRTPQRLLHEIVLVDDGSSAPWLGQQLDDYVALLPKTKLVRLPQRTGLMMARRKGAEAATGPTLTFLDSHIECNHRWLEPLVARIAEDRRHVVMPVIDSIESDLFTYHVGGISVLGFSWALGQTPVNRPVDIVLSARPLPSPIMAGGLFTIDRTFWWQLGAYDPEFREYGGEEMEISWKIWMCGGTLECIPCSHVAHIFRSKGFVVGQVYPVNGTNIHRNKLRAAEIWMDDFKAIPQAIMGKMGDAQLGPGLDDLRQLRRDLECKSFRWYLDNVYPELQIPDLSVLKSTGEFRAGDGICLDNLQNENDGDELGVYHCHGMRGSQEFAYNQRTQQIAVGQSGYLRCLTWRKTSPHFIMKPCTDGQASQRFRYDEATRQFVHADDRCLQVNPYQATAKSPFSLELAPCDTFNANQIWTINKK